MTKVKAFFICFFIPIIITSLPALFPYEAGEMSNRTFMMFLLIPLLPVSLFVPAFTVGREFRKYGFYGAVISAVFIAIFLDLFFYKVI